MAQVLYKLKVSTLNFIPNDLEWPNMCYFMDYIIHIWEPSFENLNQSLIIRFLMVKIKPCFHKSIWVADFIYFSLEAHVLKIFNWTRIHMDFICAFTNIEPMLGERTLWWPWFRPFWVHIITLKMCYI